MSGIEVVVLVGAGIWVAHRVSEHREKKKQQRLVTSGVHASRHGEAQLVTPSTPQRGQRQQVPVEEEEQLPLYAPPSKDLLAPEDAANRIHLPTYDETTKEDEDVKRSTQSSPFEDSGSNSEDSISRNSSMQSEHSPQRTVRFDTEPNTSQIPSPATESRQRPKKWKLWERSSSKKETETAQAQAV